MLLQLLGVPVTLVGLFIVQVVGGMALYYGLSWLSFKYFFVWRKEHYFPGEPMPDPAEDVQARKLAFWNLIGNAVLGTPFQFWIFTGRGRLYYKVSDYGWGYFFASIVIFLLVTEFLVYWAHRILHQRWLYKHLHLYHHLYRKPTPWVSMAFHPLDSWLQALPTYLCALYMPLHISIYAVAFVFLMVWTFFIHDRVSFVRLPFVHYTAHHTLHHIYNKDNYGQYFTLFDRLFGSHRDPMEEKKHAVMYPPTEEVPAIPALRKAA